jgi:hypothetical protein
MTPISSASTLIGNGRTHRAPAAALDGEALEIDAGLERVRHGIEEVQRMASNVEADEVVREHALEHLAAPRQHAERLGVRPRDVPEQRHAQIGTPLLDEARREREVIVLDEHERRLVADFLHDGVGEALVDLAVALPVRQAEPRPHVGDVAQRPERAVREAE